MINTFNESKLHLKLKNLYALEYNGKTEVKLDDAPWIFDIITEDGNAIEIQTSNLSSLTEKCEYLLESGRKVRIVHTVFEEKVIETYEGNGNLLHRKKSPKKASLFDSLRGMTKLCHVLTNKNCTLEILYVRITEERRKTDGDVQSKNKSRRHLKDWISEGKRLEEILRKERFEKPQDYLSLLPDEIRGTEFRLCDLQREIKKARSARDTKWASLLIWILMKMNLLEVSRTQGRSRFFRIKG